IGNGVVIDPSALFDEIAYIKEKGIKIGELRISERAHIVFPYHKIFDSLAEEISTKIGTTRRGIGPTYDDKVSRIGIRVCELSNKSILKEKLRKNLFIKEKILCLYNKKCEKIEKILKAYAIYGKKIKRYATDTTLLLNNAIKDGKNILLEGAQGTHLDIDHGTYPYCTSSSTIAGGASIGTGIPPNRIDKIVGIMKAYTTRVGEGPLPTEIKNRIGRYILEKGKEYGTTTGRVRRCGWLDLVQIKYSNMINGFTSMALTKIDVLSGLKKVKVCIRYEYNGKEIKNMPSDTELLWRSKPVYVEFKGWKMDKDSWQKCKKSFDLLPSALREYLDYIQNEVGIEFEVISYSPKRDDTIDLIYRDYIR
ncbi:MAG: adenylosuccinate synthase, partial [Candidatus Thermoplasmatota archaeon]